MMRILSKVVLILTALAAINVGLAMWDKDMFKAGFLADYPMLVGWIFLIAGLLSLALFVQAIATGNCDCMHDHHDRHIGKH